MGKYYNKNADYPWNRCPYLKTFSVNLFTEEYGWASFQHGFGEEPSQKDIEFMKKCVQETLEEGFLFKGVEVGPPNRFSSFCGNLGKIYEGKFYFSRKLE